MDRYCYGQRIAGDGIWYLVSAFSMWHGRLVVRCRQQLAYCSVGLPSAGLRAGA